MINTQRSTKAKYFIIGLVRIMGVAILAIGFAVILNDFMQLPAAIGYFLVVMGAFEFIAMPIILARAWKTPDDDEKRKNAGIEKV